MQRLLTGFDEKRSWDSGGNDLNGNGKLDSGDVILLLRTVVGLDKQPSSGNTIKMGPHYAGWMHGRCHGFRSIEGVAINHDINHLTVLNWAQTLPFYNDTFDWPQWPALDVSNAMRTRSL